MYIYIYVPTLIFNDVNMLTYILDLQLYNAADSILVSTIRMFCLYYDIV